jgi:hypothetical protein
MIGTPCVGGQVSSLYARSVLNFQKACLGREDARLELVAHWGDSLTTRARQGLVTQFLGHPAATHLLFVNGDVGFWPDQIFRLLKFDAGITAAAVPRKKLDRAVLTKVKKNSETLPFDFEPESPKPTSREGFVKAAWAGTGVMLITRGALQAMTHKYGDLRYRSEFGIPPDDLRYWNYALFNCMIEGDKGRFLSADESFCKRWTDLGGEIWVDLESALKGVGPKATPDSFPF